MNRRLSPSRRLLGVLIAAPFIVAACTTSGDDGESEATAAAEPTVEAAVDETAVAVAEATDAPTDRVGRIQVKHDLTVPGYPDIWVVGDLAAAEWAPGQMVPGVAQGDEDRLRICRRGIDSPSPEDIRRCLVLLDRERGIGDRESEQLVEMIEPIRVCVDQFADGFDSNASW